MANVESQSVDHQRFRIHIGGRTLPTSPPDTDDSQSSSHESRYEILQTENALAEMSQFLEKQLRQRVLTGESILNAITIKQAVERYAAQIRRLNEFCNEWLTMLAGIIHIGGSAEGKGSDGLVSERLKTEVESWRADLLHEAKADGFISESIVTAKLAAKPLPEFKRELSEHIEASVVRTKGTMLEQLVNLVDREVLGVIEWYADDKCCYHHFTRECDVQLRRQSSHRSVTALETGQLRGTHVLHAAGTAKRSLVRRIQHLVSARSLALGETTLPIPRFQMGIIRGLPSWIAPAIRVVEGTLIRETVVTQEQECHQWTEERVLENVIYWHKDPALVLGPFVLSAWGQAEIESEVTLQEQESQASLKASQPMQRTISTHRLLGFLSLMLACAFVVVWRFSAINLLVGTVCGVVACVLLSRRWSPEPCQRNEKEQAMGYAIGMVAMSLLTMFLVPAGLILLGIVCFGMALLALILYLNRTADWDDFREEAQSMR